ncbi:hypothetical protein ACFLRU_06805 [Bacteroidota bacterium]
MIKKTSIWIFVAFLATSCVSKKLFVDLEDKYNQLSDEKKELLEKNDAFGRQK